MSFTVEETGRYGYVTRYKGDNYADAEQAFRVFGETTPTKVTWFGNVNTALDIVATWRNPRFTQEDENALITQWDKE